jgi:hypothetical protein
LGASIGRVPFFTMNKTQKSWTRNLDIPALTSDQLDIIEPAIRGALVFGLAIAPRVQEALNDEGLPILTDSQIDFTLFDLIEKIDSKMR